MHALSPIVGSKTVYEGDSSPAHRNMTAVNESSVKSNENRKRFVADFHTGRIIYSE